MTIRNSHTGMFEYEGVRRITYGDAYFVPVCEKCGRFVKADKTIRIYEEAPDPLGDRPNATCSLHGRIQMVFEGFY